MQLIQVPFSLLPSRPSSSGTNLTGIPEDHSDFFWQLLGSRETLGGILFSGSFCAIFWLKKRGPADPNDIGDKSKMNQSSIANMMTS